jgi:hypothetical protein
VPAIPGLGAPPRGEVRVFASDSVLAGALTSEGGYGFRASVAVLVG